MTPPPTHATLPHLRRKANISQLYVHDKPFLALGGELGNSNASDLTILQGALDKCARMHLNTIMLPVYWDLIEPEEGKLDFSLVQGAIDLARERDQHLVLLWFGTWKNSMSCYAPTWVKRDTTRFPRAQRAAGQSLEIISPASAEARNADQRAFTALMRFVKTYDGKKHTVIMVQVENEIGMIPEPRDHSPLSQSQYTAPVPQKLLTLLQRNALGPELQSLWQSNGSQLSGTWGGVFGTTPEADELFSAWQFCNYLEPITAAGKAEYPLPMFTNAALIRAGYKPGQYPSAGPLPHLIELYRAFAPSLDFLAPDIYFPNFMEWSNKYNRSGNALFIPEMAASLRAPANAVYAIAHDRTIGIGPFSIENVSEEKANDFADCYAALHSIAPLILKAQESNTIAGLSPQIQFDWSTTPEPQRTTLANITFTAKFDTPNTGDTTTTTLPTLGSGRWDAPPGTPLGAALIIQLAEEEFLILAKGTTLTFTPADGTGGAHIGIDQSQEGTYTNNTWQGARYLNGDETHQGRHLHFHDKSWTLQHLRLYHYQ